MKNIESIYKPKQPSDNPSNRYIRFGEGGMISVNELEKADSLIGDTLGHGEFEFFTETFDLVKTAKLLSLFNEAKIPFVVKSKKSEGDIPNSWLIMILKIDFPRAEKELNKIPGSLEVNSITDEIDFVASNDWLENAYSKGGVVYGDFGDDYIAWRLANYIHLKKYSGATPEECLAFIKTISSAPITLANVQNKIKTKLAARGYVYGGIKVFHSGYAPEAGYKPPVRIGEMSEFEKIQLSNMADLAYEHNVLASQIPFEIWAKMLFKKTQTSYPVYMLRLLYEAMKAKKHGPGGDLIVPAGWVYDTVNKDYSKNGFIIKIYSNKGEEGDDAGRAKHYQILDKEGNNVVGEALPLQQALITGEKLATGKEYGTGGPVTHPIDSNIRVWQSDQRQIYHWEINLPDEKNLKGIFIVTKGPEVKPDVIVKLVHNDGERSAGDYKAQDELFVANKDLIKRSIIAELEAMSTYQKGKFADGGNTAHASSDKIRTPQQIMVISRAAKKEVEGLTPQQVADRWNDSRAFPDIEHGKWTAEEVARNPEHYKFYLAGLLFERQLTEPEYAKYMRRGGKMPHVKPESIYVTRKFVEQLQPETPAIKKFNNGGRLDTAFIFLKSIDVSLLPDPIAELITSMLEDPEIIYLHDKDEDFVELKNLLEEKFPDAIKKLAQSEQPVTAMELEPAPAIEPKIKIPGKTFYARIKPFSEGALSKEIRIVPDSAGGFIAGYVIYEQGSNKQAGYMMPEQIQALLDSGDYEMIDGFTTEVKPAVLKPIMVSAIENQIEPPTIPISVLKTRLKIITSLAESDPENKIMKIRKRIVENMISDYGNTAIAANVPQKKYRNDVVAIGENRWSNNAQEYNSIEEAKKALDELRTKWFGYDLGRIVTTDTPQNEILDEAKQDIYQNFRKKAEGGALEAPYADKYPEAITTLGIELMPDSGHAHNAWYRRILIDLYEMEPGEVKTFRLAMFNNALKGNKQAFHKEMEALIDKYGNRAIRMLEFISKDIIGGSETREYDNKPMEGWFDAMYEGIRKLFKLKTHSVPGTALPSVAINQYAEKKEEGGAIAGAIEGTRSSSTDSYKKGILKYNPGDVVYVFQYHTNPQLGTRKAKKTEIKEYNAIDSKYIVGSGPSEQMWSKVQIIEPISDERYNERYLVRQLDGYRKQNEFSAGQNQMALDNSKPMAIGISGEYMALGGKVTDPEIEKLLDNYGSLSWLTGQSFSALTGGWMVPVEELKKKPESYLRLLRSRLAGSLYTEKKCYLELFEMIKNEAEKYILPGEDNIISLADKEDVPVAGTIHGFADGGPVYPDLTLKFGQPVTAVYYHLTRSLTENEEEYIGNQGLEMFYLDKEGEQILLVAGDLFKKKDAESIQAIVEDAMGSNKNEFKNLVISADTKKFIDMREFNAKEIFAKEHGRHLDLKFNTPVNAVRYHLNRALTDQEENYIGEHGLEIFYVDEDNEQILLVAGDLFKKKDAESIQAIVEEAMGSIREFKNSIIANDTKSFEEVNEISVKQIYARGGRAINPAWKSGYAAFVKGGWDGDDSMYSKKGIKQYIKGYERIAEDLVDGKVKPSQVIGTTNEVKPQLLYRTAKEWLSERIKELEGFQQSEGLTIPANIENFKFFVERAFERKNIDREEYDRLLQNQTEVLSPWENSIPAYGNGGTISASDIEQYSDYGVYGILKNAVKFFIRSGKFSSLGHHITGTFSDSKDSWKLKYIASDKIYVLITAFEDGELAAEYYNNDSFAAAEKIKQVPTTHADSRPKDLYDAVFFMCKYLAEPKQISGDMMEKGGMVKLSIILNSPAEIEKIAKNFSLEIFDYIGQNNLDKIVELNDIEADPQICHSHDFMDANMAMHEAMQRAGLDIDKEPGLFEDQDYFVLFNKAWAVARQNKFWHDKIGELTNPEIMKRGGSLRSIWKKAKKQGKYLFKKASLGIKSVISRKKKGGTLEYEEVEVVPDTENDCFISDIISRGYSISCSGKFIGNTPEYTLAIEMANDWMEENKFFPHRWFINERGDTMLIDAQGNELKYATGGAIEIPASLFYIKIKPSKQGRPYVYARVFPEGDAGYIIYTNTSPAHTYTQSGFIKKQDFETLINDGTYTMVEKSEVPDANLVYAQLIDGIAKQYGWTVKEHDDTFEMYNRKGVLAASIKSKGDKYYILDSANNILLSGQKQIEESVKKVLTQYFYASPVVATANLVPEIGDEVTIVSGRLINSAGAAIGQVKDKIGKIIGLGGIGNDFIVQLSDGTMASVMKSGIRKKLSNGGSLDLPELQPNEIAILTKILKKNPGMTITEVQRKSPAMADVIISGMRPKDEDKSETEHFSSWLPLETIKQFGEWNKPEIANMTISPSRALVNDWTSVRDSSIETIWKIFSYVLNHSNEVSRQMSDGGPVLYTGNPGDRVVIQQFGKGGVDLLNASNHKRIDGHFVSPEEAKAYAASHRLTIANEFDSINWKAFSLNGLKDLLDEFGDIHITSFRLKSDPIIVSNIDYKKVGNKTLSIGDEGMSITLHRSNENIYLTLTVYDEAANQYQIDLFSKENHAGLKKIQNQIVERFSAGGAIDGTSGKKINLGDIVLFNNQQYKTGYDGAAFLEGPSGQKLYVKHMPDIEGNVTQVLPDDESMSPEFVRFKKGGIIAPTGQYIVKCASVGNPDFGQNYWQAMSPPEQFVIKTPKEASLKCREYIERYRLGGGNWVGGDVYDHKGKVIANVSYNGRVWPGGEWNNNMVEITDDATFEKVVPYEKPTTNKENGDVEDVNGMSDGGRIRKFCDVGTKIQTMLFSKEHYSLAQAVKWLKDNNFTGRNIDEKENTYRFEQIDPDKFKRETFRTTNFHDKLPIGVQAVIACPVQETVEELEKGGPTAKETFLLNSSGLPHDIKAKQLLQEYGLSLMNQDEGVLKKFVEASGQNLNNYDGFFYLNHAYHTPCSDKWDANKITYRATIEEALQDALNENDKAPDFIHFAKGAMGMTFGAVAGFNAAMPLKDAIEELTRQLAFVNRNRRAWLTLTGEEKVWDKWTEADREKVLDEINFGIDWLKIKPYTRDEISAFAKVPYKDLPGIVKNGIDVYVNTKVSGRIKEVGEALYAAGGTIGEKEQVKYSKAWFYQMARWMAPILDNANLYYEMSDSFTRSPENTDGITFRIGIKSLDPERKEPLIKIMKLHGFVPNKFLNRDKGADWLYFSPVTLDQPYEYSKGGKIQAEVDRIHGLFETDLINQPFMKAIAGTDEEIIFYELNSQDSGDQVNREIWITIKDIPQSSFKAFKNDYKSFVRDFEAWARDKGLYDPQILPNEEEGTMNFRVSQMIYQKGGIVNPDDPKKFTKEWYLQKGRGLMELLQSYGLKSELVDALSASETNIKGITLTVSVVEPWKPAAILRYAALFQYQPKRNQPDASKIILYPREGFEEGGVISTEGLLFNKAELQIPFNGTHFKLDFHRAENSPSKWPIAINLVQWLHELGAKKVVTAKSPTTIGIEYNDHDYLVSLDGEGANQNAIIISAGDRKWTTKELAEHIISLIKNPDFRLPAKKSLIIPYEEKGVAVLGPNNDYEGNEISTDGRIFSQEELEIPVSFSVPQLDFQKAALHPGKWPIEINLIHWLKQLGWLSKVYSAKKSPLAFFVEGKNGLHAGITIANLDTDKAWTTKILAEKIIGLLELKLWRAIQDYGNGKYKKGGQIPDQTIHHWMSDAIKYTDALKVKAKAMGWITDDNEAITNEVLEKLKKLDKGWAKKVALSDTYAKFSMGGAIHFPTTDEIAQARLEGWSIKFDGLKKYNGEYKPSYVFEIIGDTFNSKKEVVLHVLEKAKAGVLLYQKALRFIKLMSPAEWKFVKNAGKKYSALLNAL